MVLVCGIAFQKISDLQPRRLNKKGGSCLFDSRSDSIDKRICPPYKDLESYSDATRIHRRRNKSTINKQMSTHIICHPQPQLEHIQHIQTEQLHTHTHRPHNTNHNNSKHNTNNRTANTTNNNNDNNYHANKNTNNDTMDDNTNNNSNNIMINIITTRAITSTTSTTHHITIQTHQPINNSVH